jgi:hypothetical protein
MEEIIKAHLEGVYKEYVEYRDYYKSIYKTPEERRTEIANKITTESEPQEVLDSIFIYNFKYNRHEQDIYNLLTRLFHTIRAYQDLIEIPEELLKEVENFKMIQAYTVKNGEEKEINKEENEQLKVLLKQNYDKIVQEFNTQPT